MTGKKESKRREFIVMNSQLEYFSGMMYGGELVWCNDYKEAKPLNHEDKFKTLERMCYGEELILDYIDADPKKSSICEYSGLPSVKSYESK